MDDELRKHLIDMEVRLVRHINVMTDHVETALITDFHKWASPVEARARGTREVLHALDLEVELLKERVARLEGQRPLQ